MEIFFIHRRASENLGTSRGVIDWNRIGELDAGRGKNFERGFLKETRIWYMQNIRENI